MPAKVNSWIFRSLAGANEPAPTAEEYWLLRKRIIARVAHLIPRRRVEVERAARLLRFHFVNRRDRAPKRGTLHRLMLVGEYADTDRRDREDGDRTDLEIWAFVDHAAYKGMNRYWGIARRAVAGELRGRASLTLSVFTLDEMERIRAAGNLFLTSRYNAGIVIYDRAIDGPGEQAEAHPASHL
ncbi:hypothetical protein [Sphingobium yanoikuyae]|jgi:hypothetical protein|uniref:hypothetical protein n=1 Tax=Sphingobium TaxID=165695 RepID=UPI0013784485|nr:hypothetical protein [Sphingobium yanoikuyae]KAK0361273.1 hypothetical protein LTR94_023741 [Friedmanniomyces endolithicus]NBB41728.1 hypothetical protein [Sphingobium yanoikuyae]